MNVSDRFGTGRDPKPTVSSKRRLCHPQNRGYRLGVYPSAVDVIVSHTNTDFDALAAMLAANGRFDSAAQELEAIAEEGVGGVRDRIAATAMRANLN